MSLGLWIGLVCCNIAWAVNPTFAKVVIGELGPEFAAWIKYAGAFLIYLLILLIMAMRKPGGLSVASSAFIKPSSRADLISVATIGFATFFLAPLTQMVGLNTSTAVTNSLLIAFEPIFTVIFGWLLLRERLNLQQVLGFCLALIGFSLISGLASAGSSGTGTFSISVSDIILLIAVAGEGIYSVLAKGLVQRYSARSIYGSAMSIGLVLLTAVILFWRGFPPLNHLSLKGWVAVLWLGSLGSVAPYLYWLHALNRELPLASIVLTLFLQPVIGAAAGILFLGEAITPMQIMGGALILAAVFVQMVRKKVTAAAPGYGATPVGEEGREIPEIKLT